MIIAEGENMRVFSVLAVSDTDCRKLMGYLKEHSSTVKQIVLENQEGFFCDEYDLFLESEFKNDMEYYYFKKNAMKMFKIDYFVSFLIRDEEVGKLGCG